MTRYIGTKILTAALPMTRKAYNDYRGWSVPEDENPADEGYLVEYEAGGESNHPNHDGYISWSPKEVFEAAYRPTEGMTFGMAIEAMKAGFRVARRGWNGKSMWIVRMTGMSLPPYNTQGTERKVNDRTARWIGEDMPLETLPYYAMWTADQKWLPGWLASQSDIDAEDWQIVD